MIGLKKVSEMLGVCELTVREWVHEGKIKCTYLDNEMLFNADDVDEFIRETKIKLITPDHQMDEIMKFLDKDFSSIERSNCFVTNKNTDTILNSYCEKNDVLTPDEIERLFNESSK